MLQLHLRVNLPDNALCVPQSRKEERLLKCSNFVTLLASCDKDQDARAEVPKFDVTPRNLNFQDNVGDNLDMGKNDAREAMQPQLTMKKRYMMSASWATYLEPLSQKGTSNGWKSM